MDPHQSGDKKLALVMGVAIGAWLLAWFAVPQCRTFAFWLFGGFGLTFVTGLVGLVRRRIALRARGGPLKVYEGGAAIVVSVLMMLASGIFVWIGIWSMGRVTESFMTRFQTLVGLGVVIAGGVYGYRLLKLRDKSVR